MYLKRRLAPERESPHHEAMNLKPTLLVTLALVGSVGTGAVAVHDCRSKTTTTTDGGAPPAPTRFGAFPSVGSFQWVNVINGANGGSYGPFSTFSGHLAGLHCVLQTVNAPPLFVQCFDTNASPSNGATPVAGCVSGGLNAVGNDVTFSDESDLAYQHGGGSLPLTTGLYIALSTTQGTLTFPAAGNTAHCDALVGP